MRYPALATAALALLATASCANGPDGEPMQAEGLKLTALTVAETLKAGVRYPAVMDYEAEGDVTVLVSCFLWSGEGPYCFGSEQDAGGKQVTTMLITRNPGRYRLEGYVKYTAGGAEQESNRVASTIVVEP